MTPSGRVMVAINPLESRELKSRLPIAAATTLEILKGTTTRLGLSLLGHIRGGGIRCCASNRETPPMKTKSIQSRSINIKLSVRTYNDLDKFLSEQEAAGGK